MALLYITIAFFIAYSILILYYKTGWAEVSVFVPPGGPRTTKISVIIPARNEEKNIGNLLTALASQSYPRHLYEIIVIDDHSEDNTASEVKRYSGVKLIQLKEENLNSYKKKAIETGIAAATGELIVTTDADCIAGPGWLKTIAAFKEEKQACFIAAPVVLSCNYSLLQMFQSLDFLVLQGITAACVHKKFHTMCNGANIAYDKKAFYEAKGFTGIDHIASGDDMLLMKKIAQRYPDKIYYLLSKEAIVSTPAEKTWRAFFDQRIRWASKATQYDDKRITGVLLLVYISNLFLLVLSVAGFRVQALWYGLAVLLILKTVIELIFVFPVARFFGKQRLLSLFPFFQPLHILYTVLAGLFGQFGRYNWKGRKVK
jgi:cellulose synthase/poly-beta-1,6-N-acetylglucosamine synthase-like glycosyltransferase